MTLSIPNLAFSDGCSYFFFSFFSFTLLKIVPGHIESIVRYANFERRQSPQDLSAAEIVYASQLEVENVDETTQMAIVTLYAKFLWQAKKDVEAARAVFKTGEGKFDSRFYFSNYLKFEMSQEGKRIGGPKNMLLLLLCTF